MNVRLIFIGVLFCLCCSSLRAQQPPANTAALAGSLESIRSIEDPAARIAALQKFLKTNIIAEQALAAREAIVASWAQLAEGQLSANNIERANADFQRALAALPENVTDRFFEETVIRIPLAVSVRGYRTEAIALARHLEKRFAKEQPRLAALGEFYMTVEAPADATRALEAAAQLGTADARLHRALGAAYRMGLRIDEAVAEYQAAIGLDPQERRAYFELANLYRALGAYPDAIKLYRQQLEIEPNHPPSLKGLALSLLAQGDEEQATATLTRARGLRGGAEEVTRDIYLQTQLAFHYLARNKMALARNAADAALTIEPRYAWARIAAAEVDLAEGKYFDAERNLLAATRYANFPTLHFTLGKLYLAVEDFDTALEQFAKAFAYSSKDKFTANLGGALDVQAEKLRELLAREHQAAIFLAEAPTNDEQFKIAEALVRFNYWLSEIKAMNDAKALGKTARKSVVTNKEMEELDRAALDFVGAENTRRSFRALYATQRLAQSGLATGLAVELAEQALGLAEAATATDGSLRDYPNYDREGRLRIFRGRALAAKGWALFKAGRNDEAGAALNEALQAYGTLPESKRAQWRLATVKEAAGEMNAALDLYIAAYEPPESGSAPDVNYTVLESLYRKLHGSSEGLAARLGRPIASNSAARNIAATKASPDPVEPSPRASREQNQKTTVLPSAALSRSLPPIVSSSASNVKPTPAAPNQPINEQTVIISSDDPPPAPLTNKPVILQRTVTLPALNARRRPRLPLLKLGTAILQQESFVFSTDNLPQLETPPPPTPRGHTRRRRVTVPDDRPPQL
jgi:tetratricopeptide (TPR) repeat protein